MSIKSKVKSFIMKIPLIRSVFASIRPVVMKNEFYKTYKDDFIEYIAKKRKIDLHKAQILVTNAEKQFSGGWGGDKYRQFTEIALEAARPFYDDTTDQQVIETYKFHAVFDFLRMLSYPCPNLQDVEPIVKVLTNMKKVSIVDYGCGLAHRTIAVARYLLERKIEVMLYFVDIGRKLHLSFLDYLCTKYGIDYEFIEITFENLYPVLPQHNYCDNVSVFEHIREPIIVLNNINQALEPGGIFLAMVDDCIEEMMHITPNLKAVRNRLAELKYEKIASYHGTPLLQKPMK
jgi:SAM-dependent methyltransferase